MSGNESIKSCRSCRHWDRAVIGTLGDCERLPQLLYQAWGRGGDRAELDSVTTWENFVCAGYQEKE